VLEQQLLDVLVKPISRAEEQVALRRHALDPSSARGQDQQLFGPRWTAECASGMFRDIPIIRIEF